MVASKYPTVAGTTPATAREVLQARQLYIDQGVEPGVLIPELIRKSWVRCNTTFPQFKRCFDPLTPYELAIRREAQGRLRHNALPELDALAEALQASRVIVLLADPYGVILDAAGSHTFMGKAEHVALMPGATWSESNRGTNAIGTALTENRSVSVLGAQHFHPENTLLGCTAVPLLSPDGEVMGVLDVSGDPRNIQAHTVGLVRMAATMIEHRVALDAIPPDTEVLRFSHEPALIGSHREALLWVRNGLIVGANRTALTSLKRELNELCGRRLEDVFMSLPGPSQACAKLTVNSGMAAGARSLSCFASWLTEIHRVPPRGAAVRPATEVVPTTTARGAWCSQSTVSNDRRDQQMRRAVRVLDSDIAVLILGESGVGKEVFAREMHAKSRRSKGPFVAINCAAVPEQLIESELFGYEDGAFTGSRRSGQKGLIREAQGGILFLDEIGDMPLKLQSRLLRVLQDHAVQPLGAGAATSVDFALVCATHRDLEAMVGSGEFRADLLYRLQHFEVALPALRDMPDRAAVIDEYLDQWFGPHRILVGSKVREFFHAHAWPGNWRQFSSLCQTLLALAPPNGKITFEDLPDRFRRSCADKVAERSAAQAVSPVPRATLFDPRTEAGHGLTSPTLSGSAIAEALRMESGNISRAARRLGVHRSTLYRHLPQTTPQ